MSILMSIVIVGHLLAGVVLVIKLAKEIEKQRNPRRTKPVKPRAGTRGVNRSLETRLVCLMRNDVQAAHRLVGSARNRHPGRSENWYWEKAIADLERDRR